MNSVIKLVKPQQPAAGAGRTLTGWKEIAGYLCRDIRSVPRWEKRRGLPIRRVVEDGGGGRPVVHALSGELDGWLRGFTAPPDARAESAPAPPPPAAAAVRPPETPPAPGPRGWLRLAAGPAHRWALAGFLLLAGMIVAGTAVLTSNQGEPESVVLEAGYALVAHDAGGKRLWQRDFTPKNSTPIPADEDVAPLLVDLNQDSRKEVLFVYRTLGEDARDTDRVVCLDEKGREIWLYHPGGTVVMGGMTIPNSSGIRKISAAGLLAGGRHFVVVIANSRLMSASQVSVLNPAGLPIGQYWHAGWIFDCETLDVNHDGTDEIALAGVDEPAGKAFVALIAADIGKSMSPVPDGYAPGLEARKELAYLLFPVSLPASSLGRENRAVRVEKHRSPEGLTVEIEQQGGERDVLERTYLLDAQLRVLELQMSDEFLLQTRRLREAKLLSADWEVDEMARLRQIQPVIRR